ncbi:hypothetical protein PVAG01_10955 [Phlyctema vagabunda]|uniref:4Fe-4S ferredoxin-type domain-containing protein n=1 Tax=Phlyctema vagabunda TaxID=108571 RepID=A0ABR4P3T8_9HELO
MEVVVAVTPVVLAVLNSIVKAAKEYMSIKNHRPAIVSMLNELGMKLHAVSDHVQRFVSTHNEAQLWGTIVQSCHDEIYKFSKKLAPMLMDSRTDRLIAYGLKQVWTGTRQWNAGGMIEKSIQARINSLDKYCAGSCKTCSTAAPVNTMGIGSMETRLVVGDVAGAFVTGSSLYAAGIDGTGSAVATLPVVEDETEDSFAGDSFDTFETNSVETATTSLPEVEDETEDFSAECYGQGNLG